MKRQLPPDVREMLVRQLSAALAAAYVRQQSVSESKKEVRKAPRKEEMRTR